MVGHEREDDQPTGVGSGYGWIVDVFERGQKVGQVRVVRWRYVGGDRMLFDADGRTYRPRAHGLGVEEVVLAGE